MKKRTRMNAKSILLITTMILGIFAASAFAVDKRIDMQGSTATIPTGNTVTRSLYRIPSNQAGQIRLRLKWHAVAPSPRPVFNRLRVRLKHGNTILVTRNCYSYHSDKSGKCVINQTITQTEANRSGPWSIEVTNNSRLQVIGFDVEKGSDRIPLVPSFRSVFRYTATTTACSTATRTIDMQGSTATIPKGNTVTRTLYKVSKSKGVILLRAKWHAVNPIPYFNRLSVKLIKPNGQVARSKTAHSFHNKQGKSKMVIQYQVTAADAALSGNWKIQVQNNSGLEVIGFDVEKGSDINPFVPSFKSTFKGVCP